MALDNLALFNLASINLALGSLALIFLGEHLGVVGRGNLCRVWLWRSGRVAPVVVETAAGRGRAVVRELLRAEAALLCGGRLLLLLGKLLQAEAALLCGSC